MEFANQPIPFNQSSSVPSSFLIKFQVVAPSYETKSFENLLPVVLT